MAVLVVFIPHVGASSLSVFHVRFVSKEGASVDRALFKAGALMVRDSWLIGGFRGIGKLPRLQPGMAMASGSLQRFRSQNGIHKGVDGNGQVSGGAIRGFGSAYLERLRPLRALLWS